MFYNRIIILFTVLGLLGCSQNKSAKNSPQDSGKFNIVFILADDLGWNQIGFNGTEFYETPNIDKIASQGMIFTNAYAAASICSPTRASIMTGKNPARLHITDYIPGSPYPYAKLSTPHMTMGLPLKEITIPEMLKEHNYVTGHFGKWHLNKDKNYKPGRPGDPGSQGFDEVLTTVKPTPDADPNKDAHHTNLITSRALKFIEKNKDKPFFAYVSYHAVHRPIMEKADLIAKYEAKPGAKDSINNPIMGAMIETMDNGIGQILDELDSLQLTKNTLVIFYSDNGGLKSLQHQDPFRGGKAMIFEGGTRVPLAIKLPGVIRSGSTCNFPVTSDDMFPTLAEIVGQKDIPKDIDGRSLWPLLTDKADTLSRTALYWHYPHYHHQGYKPGATIVEGDYKLIEWFEPLLREERNVYGLYNIFKDVGETHNLATEMPDKVNELKEKLHQWQKDLGVQRMTVNPNYDPTRADWRFIDSKEDE